jgi:hypothetical protein
MGHGPSTGPESLLTWKVCPCTVLWTQYVTSSSVAHGGSLVRVRAAWRCEEPLDAGRGLLSEHAHDEKATTTTAMSPQRVTVRSIGTRKSER